MTKEISNQALLEAINQGFNGVQKQFEGVNDRFDKVENRLDNVENRLTSLEKGQEDIQLRLTNVAYRFELQELQQRVQVLEDKVNDK